MLFSDGYFQNKIIVSLSPFNYLKVTSGVTWRISFVVSLLRKNTKLGFEIMRSQEKIAVDHNQNNLYMGSKNKYIHLFDPRIIYFLILLIKKHTIMLYCHTLWSGFYALFFKIFFRIPFVYDNHNVEFDRFKSRNSYFSWLVFIFEYSLIYLSDYTSVCSGQDQKRIKSLYGLDNTFVTLNDFTEKIKISPPLDKVLFLKSFNLNPNKKIILFFGSFDYYPNLEALSFIEEKIAPNLDPDIFHVVIAGKGSEKLKKNIAQITYLGFVDNIDDLICASNLIIAPIFSGAGVKIKLLHAISLDAPIITTEEGMRGIDLEHNCIVAHQDNFLEKIILFFPSN